MAYENESDLKYIDSLDEIPVVGHGIDQGWSKDDKLEAAEAGESKLEGDVNEGHAISESQRVSFHGEAAATWATYKLVLGMKAPDSTTRGDSLDEGTDRMEFADRIKKMYSSHINTINRAEGFQSEEDEDTVTFEVADW